MTTSQVLTRPAPDRAARLRRLSWGLSGLATVVWGIVVSLAGWWSRVVTQWASAVTMLFGSFLAGSSPEGGGAVAFPVFTKGLHVPPPVARTFGLSIQAVGMTMAVISIVLFRRAFHHRAAVLGSVAGVIGFLVSAVVVGRPGEVFWPSIIPGAWVKATFSIVLATTSLMMIRHLKDHHGESDSPPWNRRYDMGLVIAALAGGFLSGITGTGANILVFLFLIVLADTSPKVALPTVVIVMATVSIVGFVMFGLFDGQLDVVVEGGRVTGVGGQAADLAASHADLLGLWLAAVPVVVWGAPLGSLAASLVREQHLVGFVAVLAATEVITTFILVPELRTSPPLIAYLVIGLVALPGVFLWCRQNRHTLFAV